jgi:hypothetical protein
LRKNTVGDFLEDEGWAGEMLTLMESKVARMLYGNVWILEHHLTWGRRRGGEQYLRPDAV